MRSSGSHPHNLYAGALKRLNALIAGICIRDEHVKVCGVADSPSRNLSKFRAVDHCDSAAGKLDHCGVEIRLIRTVAACAPGSVNPIGAHEERVNEHRLQALNRRRPTTENQ